MHALYIRTVCRSMYASYYLCTVRMLHNCKEMCWILAARCTIFFTPAYVPFPSIPKLEVAQSAENKVKSLQAELSQAVSERDQAHLQLQKEQRRVEELEKQVCLCVCVRERERP